MAFVDEYHKKFNENPIAVAVAAAQGYDSLYLLKQAIEQAKSTDGDKIRLALENLQQPFVGVTGTYNKPFDTQEPRGRHRRPDEDGRGEGRHRGARKEK